MNERIEIWKLFNESTDKGYWLNDETYIKDQFVLFFFFIDIGMSCLNLKISLINGERDFLPDFPIVSSDLSDLQIDVVY